MTVIQSFSPIIKFSLDHVVERTGCRPKATNYYCVSETGQRVLVPAGAGTYDVYISCTIPYLFGTETDQQLRQIAESCTPATYIEKRAPHLIRNHTYVFHIGICRTKFIKSRSRLRGNMIHDRYWFFTSRMPDNQIQARVRLLAGRLYAARAEKIQAATRRRGFEPYKDLKRTVDFFRKIGEQLIKYGERVFVRCTAADRARAQPELEKPVDQQRHAAAIVLDACRVFLPLLDPLVRLDLAMVYPELMRIPSPAAAGG